ncbi:MAG: hypothetical protein ACI4OT_02915 [Bacilli bacterium]
MELDRNLLYNAKRLLLARYSRFGSDIANINIEYNTNLKYHTAATDGKTIFFDPDYLASLSEDDTIFLIAHEIMHIKFNHVFRLIDKNGNKRDMDIWNETTDAIINANLERDGFKIKEGYVNRLGALKYSAEELYEIIKKEKEEKNSQDNQNGQGQSDNNDSSEKSNQDNQHIGDDHSLWEEAFSKQNNDNINENNNDNSETNSSEDVKSSSYSVNEFEEFSKNRQERRNIAKESLNRIKEEMLRNFNKDSAFKNVNLGSVGESKNEMDWRSLLRREVEKTETIWSQRRSIAENNYAYRLEEEDIEDEALTEVMIDVSGSVDLDLVRAFLRMLKPILKESKLRVGCFNEKFWGMVDINSIADIDNFTIPDEARGHSAWTEDWDLAVRSFSKKREVNKIVFTDGEPCPGTMPKPDLAGENVIWLVYGNDNFKPCCGKVITITEKYLEQLQTINTKDVIKSR